jgi:hypothetical protein
MTDQSSLITPPDALCAQWRTEAPIYRFSDSGVGREKWLIDRAAQWGADQELAACRAWVAEHISSPEAAELYNARRPKPPTLKEQGLESLNEVIKCLKVLVPGAPVDGIHIENIRRALEALPND